jgi:ferredoxin
MNCGFCAEFCPFDAIKMDHDYELSSYDRTENHIYDKQKLSKPFSYWYNLAPTTAFEEAVGRGGWEHSDVLKQKRKSGDTITTPVYGDVPDWMKVRSKAAASETVAEAAGPSKAELEAERKALIERKRQEALSRFRARG